jgi:hypothetical protein
MQSYLNWLEGAVADKLAQDPIGRPVFVRLSLELNPDHGLLKQALDRGVAIAARWLGGKPAGVREQGGARDGHMAALVRIDRGQTALVDTAAATGEPTASVLVVGQHGTLRMDDYPEPEALR